MTVLVLCPDWPSTTGGGVGALAATLRHAARDAGGWRFLIRGGGVRSLQLWRDRGLDTEVVPGRAWRRAGTEHWFRSLTEVERGGPKPRAIVAMTWEAAEGAIRAGVDAPIHSFAHGKDVLGDEVDAERSRRRLGVLAAPIRWLCLTRWMGDQLERLGVDRRRIDLVAPGVRGPPIVPDLPPGPPVLLSIGRLIARKGQIALVEALAMPELRDHDLRLCLVGAGPEEAVIRRRSRELGLQHRVEVLGGLDDARRDRRWARSHVFALPCRDLAGGDVEGYGLVFDEAGAWCRAALAGRSGGTGEAVDHGVTGLIVEAPEPRAWAQALRQTLDRPDRLRSWGAAGRRRWEEGHQPHHLFHSILAAVLGSSASIASEQGSASQPAAGGAHGPSPEAML